MSQVPIAWDAATLGLLRGSCVSAIPGGRAPLSSEFRFSKTPLKSNFQTGEVARLPLSA